MTSRVYKGLRVRRIYGGGLFPSGEAERRRLPGTPGVVGEGKHRDRAAAIDEQAGFGYAPGCAIYVVAAPIPSRRTQKAFTTTRSAVATTGSDPPGEHGTWIFPYK